MGIVYKQVYLRILVRLLNTGYVLCACCGLTRRSP